MSRTFASDVITGGPNYILGYLDIPQDADGSPVYKGPYTGEGQDAFDKAVTCDGNTITYRFKKPWPDFPIAIAALRVVRPLPGGPGQGRQAPSFAVFASGPYMLQGEWNEDTGGTFVRNPKWDGTEDTNRQANPDIVRLPARHRARDVVDRLIANQGDDAERHHDPQRDAGAVPPDHRGRGRPRGELPVAVQQLHGSELQPGHEPEGPAGARGGHQPRCLRALRSAATTRPQPSLSIVNPATPGYVANPNVRADGKPVTIVEGAKQLLEESGETLPYPIKLTYPIGSDATDKAFAALKATYDEAGFNVTLDGLDPSGPYYDHDPEAEGSDSDLIWGGWGADWPSISTVIPPLFDSRINLTKTSNGQDYGNYNSDAVNAAMDAAIGRDRPGQGQPEVVRQSTTCWPRTSPTSRWTSAQFYFLRGSNIENYVNSISTSGYPDLGVISVKDGGK